MQLYATGGDGDFIWSSEDPSVVAVSQHGLITTLSLGFSKIKAAMSRNSQNYETAELVLCVLKFNNLSPYINYLFLVFM